MVEMFWITNSDEFKELRNILEKGMRESFKVLSTEKLIELKEELPTNSIICFEFNNDFVDFFKKYELSLNDQLVVPICPQKENSSLVETISSLNNKNSFQVTLDPQWNEALLTLNFRAVVRLADLSRGAREFSLMGKNINKLVASSLEEISRLRKLHEKMVSLRHESIKGVKVTSKFAAGEASGGEFFDMVVGNGQLLIVMSSSTSYIATSVVLSHMEQLRSLEKFTTNDLEKYILDISNDMSKEDLENLSLMFAVIDNKNLKVKAYNFGDACILSADGIIVSGSDDQIGLEGFSKGEQIFQLERDSKVLIASSGLMKMTAGIVNNLPLAEFFKTQYENKGKTILNELFFHLKKNTEGSFLKRDASALIIEVDSNVMVQI